MLEIKRVIGDASEDFIELSNQLNKELAITDGEDHDFYHQFNGLDSIAHFLIGYENSVPVACGAFKPFDSQQAEVKRMYVIPSARGKKYSRLVLSKLEEWIAEEGYKSAILETGINQTAAIGLYKKVGYKLIVNYGQYEGVENSFCFGKPLF